jgi:hypothetical protein
MKFGQQFSALYQKVTFGFNVSLILFSGFLLTTSIVEILAHENKHALSTLVGLAVFFGGLLVICSRNVWIQSNDRKAMRELREEQSILNRARQTKLALTIPETALNCQLRIADTKKAFERLSLTGVCQIDVTEEGELCYRFPSFESDTRSSTLIESPIIIKTQVNEKEFT